MPIVVDIHDPGLDPIQVIEGPVGYLDIENSRGERVGFHWHTYRRLTGVPGLPGLGMPGARAAIRPRPSYHGATNRSRWRKDRPIALEGWTKGDNAEYAQLELDVLAAVLDDCLDAPRLMRWRRGLDGTDLQTYVRLAAEDLAVVPEINGRLLRYQAHVHASDPRGYSQELVTVSSEELSVSTGGIVFPAPFPWLFHPSAGGLASVTNQGTTKTPPLLRVYGYASAPRVRLNTTGEEIALTGEVGAGTYLDIDVAERTVLNPAGESRGNLVDFANTTWWELPPRDHSVQLLSSNFDATARVDVIYRHAYL